MSRSVSIDEMAAAINEGLEEYADLSAQGVKSAVRKSAKADFRMTFYNPDGTEAELCGNGARCVAAFAKRYNPSNATKWASSVKALIKRLKVENGWRLPGTKPPKRSISLR